MTRRLELDDLWRIPYVVDPQMSPAGDSIAFVVRTSDRESDDNVTRIWTVGTDGTDAVPLTTGPRDSSPRWAPDASALAFVSAREADEPSQIWTISAAGATPQRLTSLEYGTASAPVWSPDGRWIAVLGIVIENDGVDEPKQPPRIFDDLPFKVEGFGYAPRGLAVEVFVVPASGGGARRVTHRGRVSMSPAWSPDGTRIAFTSMLDGAELEPPTAAPFVVAVEGAEPQQVADDRLLHSFVAWMPGGDSLITVGTDYATMGQPTLYRVPADGGPRRALAPEFDLAVRVQRGLRPGPASPAFTPDGRHLLFVACDRSRDHIFAFDFASGEVRKLVGGPRSAVSGLSLTASGMAYVGCSPETTGEVCVSELDGSRQRTLTSIFTSALEGAEPFPPEERTFTAPDGQELHGWLIRGSGPKPAPLLLHVHGGPYDSWGPGFDGAELYEQVLAANGWNVLRLNARGSDGYGAAFRAALNGRWGSADEQDFHAAVDALISEGVADPERLAVGGYSYGGFVACWLTARSDRFVAAVTGGTVVNLVSICGTSDFGAQVSSFGFGAHPYYAHLAELMERSPISFVTDVNTPTLILQGEDDVACSVEQAEQWYAALRAQGKTARLVVYPGAQHGFVDTGRPSHRLDFNRQFAEWIQEHTDAPRPG